MHILPLAGILFCVTASVLAADDRSPHVELYRSGKQSLNAETQAVIVAWCENCLKSADFNSAGRDPSMTAIHARYREAAHGDYLLVSYGHPTVFQTRAGPVTVLEIIVGLNRKDMVASGLFTLDAEGRVVEHGKYNGLLPDELKPMPTPTTQPAR